jgi:RNA polymerase sigma factor (sigma-70 family)
VSVMAATASGAVPGAPRHEASDPTVWDEAAGHLRGWRDGDADALDGLVAVMTPVLWQVVRAYRLTTEEAEDVLQATWLALVHHRDAVSDPQAVGRWLVVTARRTAWRTASRTRRDLAVDPVDLEHHANGASHPSVESTVVGDDEHARLWAAVSALDERCQRLLRVVAFQPRPDYAGLSADLRMPVGSIGPTRGRCLAKLRAAFQPTPDQPDQPEHPEPR